jgi:hydroxyethylthiazole kinase
MADAVEECAEMTGYADALVLNIGTLNSLQISSMIESGKAANKKGIPVVLDPVGAGATKFRRDMVEKLLKEFSIDVIKGNAAEIALVAGSSSQMKGVESVGNYDGISETAIHAAESTGSVIVVTGKTDIVTNGKDVYEISNGHETMGKIVGTGCMSASVVASHCAVEKNYVLASAQALCVYGLAGEKAAGKSNSPMMFKTHFMDALYETIEEDLKKFNYISRRV